jgi:hypothetical protein
VIKISQEINLKELEKKAWTAYFDDGILDITVGLFVLAFGIGMTTGYTYLTALSWMVIFFFAAAKKSITLPRVGLVKFSPEREERMKKEKSFFIVFFTITAFIGLGFFVALTTGIPQSIKTIIGEMALVSYELIIVAGLCLLAYWKEIRRFYVYGAFALVVIVSGFFLEMPEGHQFFAAAYHFLAIGTVMLFVGFVILARFFKRYPHREGDADVAR